MCRLTFLIVRSVWLIGCYCTLSYYFFIFRFDDDSGSHDINSMRDMRDALGALGPVDGQNPELNNLTCSMTVIEEGDIVFLTSDGVSDNFDPVVGKFVVAKKPNKVINSTNGAKPSSGREREPKKTSTSRHYAFMKFDLLETRSCWSITSYSVGNWSIFNQVLIVVESISVWMDLDVFDLDVCVLSWRVQGLMDWCRRWSRGGVTRITWTINIYRTFLLLRYFFCGRNMSKVIWFSNSI